MTAQTCAACGSDAIGWRVLAPVPNYHGRKECFTCGATGPFRPGEPCAFCHGQPVGDAASWLDGKPRPPLPCPRCGVTTPREETP